MWSKAKPVLMVLSVVLNVGFVAMWLTHAFSGRPEGRWPPPRHRVEGEVWSPLHQKLGVTKEQWQRIEPRLEAFQKASKEQWDAMRRTRLEILDLLSAPEVDRAAVRAKQDQLLAAQRKMEEMMVENLLSEREVLTPEQRKKLFELFREHMGHRGRGGPWRDEREEGPRAPSRPDGGREEKLQ